MNLGEAKARVIKLIREYTNKGTAISDSENADYLMSMNDYFDIAQKEVATTNKLISKKVRYIQREYDGLKVDEGTHLSEDVSYELTGARAFSFELYGTGEVYIEEDIDGTWTTLESFSADGYGETYKGLLTLTNSTNDVRIRFSGDYIYDFKNLAMYSNAFPSEDAIPNGGPNYRHQLPSDYFMLKDVLLNGKPYPLYYRDTESKNKYILFPMTAIGMIEVQYYAYPSTITVDTDDSYRFEVDDDAVQAMLYYVAYLTKLEDDTFFASEMKETYYMKVNLLSDNSNEGVVTIKNVTGW